MGALEPLNAFVTDLLLEMRDLVCRVLAVQVVRQDDEAADRAIGAVKMQGERAAGNFGPAGLVGQEGDLAAGVGLAVGAVGDHDATIGIWLRLEADPARRLLAGARAASNGSGTYRPDIPARRRRASPR